MNSWGRWTIAQGVVVVVAGLSGGALSVDAAARYPRMTASALVPLLREAQ